MWYVIREGGKGILTKVGKRAWEDFLKKAQLEIGSWRKM